MASPRLSATPPLGAWLVAGQQYFLESRKQVSRLGRVVSVALQVRDALTLLLDVTLGYAQMVQRHAPVERYEIFPAYANIGDPNSPFEACPLMRSHAR